jgi:hypothetical protein
MSKRQRVGKASIRKARKDLDRLIAGLDDQIRWARRQAKFFQDDADPGRIANLSTSELTAMAIARQDEKISRLRGDVDEKWRILNEIGKRIDLIREKVMCINLRRGIFGGVTNRDEVLEQLRHLQSNLLNLSHDHQKATQNYEIANGNLQDVMLAYRAFFKDPKIAIDQVKQALQTQATYSHLEATRHTNLARDLGETKRRLETTRHRMERAENRRSDELEIPWEDSIHWIEANVDLLTVVVERVVSDPSRYSADVRESGMASFVRSAGTSAGIDVPDWVSSSNLDEPRHGGWSPGPSSSGGGSSSSVFDTTDRSSSSSYSSGGYSGDSGSSNDSGSSSSSSTD